jgi:tRNA pseudouridine55 synthase
MHHGLLVLDKPPGITSRDAVNRAARWFPRKTKIGHAGTLDPLATGVLVLAVGHATRLIEFVQAMPKLYRTTITLGATSDTDDADGTVTPHPAAKEVAEAGVRAALTRYLGEIEQVPPAYSAALVQGKRAYALAREGEEVSLSARRVRIDRIDLLRHDWPELEFDIHCGKGTYIRSIARDLGQSLGVGGYVSRLRRLRIGRFTVEDAISLDSSAEGTTGKLLPLTVAVSDLQPIAITESDSARLRNGQAIRAEGEGRAAAMGPGDELIAVGRLESGEFRPEKVIPR